MEVFKTLNTFQYYKQEKIQNTCLKCVCVLFLPCFRFFFQLSYINISKLKNNNKQRYDSSQFSLLYCRYDSSLLQVRAGSSLRDTGGTIVQVSEIYVHPYYDNLFISCDIAVLRLSTPFIFSDTIGSIPLALANDSLPVAEEGVVSGWGSLEEGGSPADDLQAVVVPIISREECRVLLPNYAIDVSMVCAGYAEGGRDACGVNSDNLIDI